MENTLETGLKFYTKLVTPDYATFLLTTNKVNRKLQETHVKFLAKQILDGNFEQTGDTIKISDTGRLMDGQHRLNAIVVSNMSVPINFCEGLKDSVFDVLDTGKVRSSADILSIQGYKNPIETASVVRYMLFLTTGFQAKHYKVSNKDILQYVQEHPEVSETIELLATENRKFRMIPLSAIASLYIIFSKLNVEECEKFFDKYYTGLDLTNDSPIYILRDMLIRDTVAKKKYTIEQKMEFMILAWNAFRQNKSLKSLRKNSEGFPKAI
jgi:hypothetical protein